MTHSEKRAAANALWLELKKSLRERIDSFNKERPAEDGKASYSPECEEEFAAARPARLPAPSYGVPVTIELTCRPNFAEYYVEATTTVRMPDSPNISSSRYPINIANDGAAFLLTADGRDLKLEDPAAALLDSLLRGSD